MANNNQNIEWVKAEPPAHLLMKGLQRLGYTPQSAIADILDNSISAKATKIHIRHIAGYEGSQLYIADNGFGMNRDVLIEAMRYGSSRSIANSELSVYGLGMKTASSTFSKRFTVISRGSEGKVNSATWDLDRQVEHPWGIEIPAETKKSHVDMLDFVANGRTGTVVLWEKAELKLADNIQRQTANEAKTYDRIESNIQEHLRFTFHRFLNGTSSKYQQVEIYFNNLKLEGFDPVEERFLLPDWFHEKQTFEQSVLVEGKHLKAPYSIQAFLLNPDDQGENRKNFEDSMQKLKFQGIYAYRDDRLIQMPNWLTFRSTPHNSLNAVRFVLDLHPLLDFVVDPDVKKSGIQLPPQMFEALQPIITRVNTEAERRNVARRKQSKIAKTPSDAHKSASESIYKHRNDFPMPPIERLNRNHVQVENQYGTNTLRLREFAEPTKPDNCVIAVPSLDDGVLYEPVFNGTDLIIKLNQNHEFYQRIYLALISDSLALEAMTNILWAFARAELNSATNIRDQFAEMRQLVSAYLRRYAEDKPDVDMDSITNE